MAFEDHEEAVGGAFVQLERGRYLCKAERRVTFTKEIKDGKGPVEGLDFVGTVGGCVSHYGLPFRLMDETSVPDCGSGCQCVKLLFVTDLQILVGEGAPLRHRTTDSGGEKLFFGNAKARSGWDRAFFLLMIMSVAQNPVILCKGFSIDWDFFCGKLAGVRSHPRRKNKDAPRVGHPLL
jgi:hypothetical protein